ncbi:COMM domain-containing protein 10 [Thecamonas trahens ATCC 50062]|uniref:COMM domain-containing protein 10 n=1 Tax=Thecamonas trahens ATCC 50062 TaxID=461836 RepID=A0A0L0DAX8_THETB|nr:COMM domain-containing protein 10 [Thecamonas trahens ATCC 50062]KNC48453.1 COMM domain-containing protein 10 [Thecamonas trahens ATCC 50062]|eukprot:XP_013758566.1 COMM domain-containing protein 10 [Thecamonas trahens ATCC 50062]
MAATEEPPVFELTARFNNAVRLINAVDGKRFPLMLTRIVQNLHRVSEAPFSPQEMTQLAGVLGMPEADITAILDAATYMFEKAAYHTLSIKKLGTALEAAAMDADKIVSVQKVWQDNGRTLLENLKSSTVTPRVLESIKSRTHLEVGQDSLRGVKELRAILQLGLEAPPGGSAEPEDVIVEMSKDQLRDFFLQCETIQGQLDALA